MERFAKWLGKHNGDYMLHDLLKEELTQEQLRSIWTTYCIMFNLEPDTAEYDKKLFEIYCCHGDFVTVNYDEFDLYMGELLC